MTFQPETTVEWGIRISLPDGTQDVEAMSTRSIAVYSLGRTADKFGEETVELVYRRIEAGPWREDGAGDEWGLRCTWTDRDHTEVWASDRHDAEIHARLYKGSAAVAIVSREVKTGAWTAFQESTQ